MNIKQLFKIILYLVMIPLGIWLSITLSPTYGKIIMIWYYISGIFGTIGATLIRYRKGYGPFTTLLLSFFINVILMTIFYHISYFLSGGRLNLELIVWFPATIIYMVSYAFSISMAVFPIVTLCFYIYRKNKLSIK